MTIKQSLIFDVTVDDFDERVIEASRAVPVLVDFWADWCPPCLVLAPILERLAAEYAGEVMLAKVEVDDNMKLAGRYKLRGFPTVILFQNGKEQDRFSGAKPYHEVQRFLREHVLGSVSES